MLKVGSGVLVRKLSETEFVLLTAAHLFDIYHDGQPLDVDEGAFFLQRNDKKNYACSFKFGADDIQTMESYQELPKPFTAETAIGLQGNDIAAIKVRVSHKKGSIPSIPPLKAQSNDQLLGSKVVMSGYPEKSIVSKGVT